MIPRSLTLSLCVGVVALLLWEVATRTGITDPALLPPASAVMVRFWALLGDADFYRHLGATLALMAQGFGLALLGGIPLGVAMGLNRTVDYALTFYVDFLRALPAAALIPMFMVLFTGNPARVLVIGLAGSLIIAVACRSGVRNAEPARREIAVVLGLNRFELFKKLLFWEMLSEFLVGARITVSITFILATVLEMLLGAHYGLGDLLLDAQPVDKPLMYSVILVMGFVGYGLNLLLQTIEVWFASIGVLHRT